MSGKRSRTYFLIFADIAAIYGSVVLAIYFRLGAEGLVDQLYLKNGLVRIGFATGVWLVSMYFHDLYDYQILSQRSQMTLRTVQAVGVSWVLLAVIYYLFPPLEIGRGTALYSIAMTLVILLSIRWSLGRVLDLDSLGERILILGDGDEVVDAFNAAVNRHAAGYRIIGTLGPAAMNGHTGPFVRTLGSINDLERIVSTERIDRVVVGVRQRRGIFPTEALLRLRLNGEVSIDECASFYENVAGKVHLDLIRPSWLIFSEFSRNTQIKAAVRDFVHRLMALTGLIVSLPLAFLAAVLIKLESNGPIFYKQQRVGKNGRTFTVIKFRSMRTDAEASGKPVWAQADDDRVTVVGKVIRKVRIDEIPQFWNILKGEMKFVGPRPERPHFVEQLAEEIPFYQHRHLVAPGLTGWAQVKYPYGASVKDARQKLEYDLYYIKNQTLRLDMLIVLQTIKIILLGRGGR